jgi:antitoxin PrlF
MFIAIVRAKGQITIPAEIRHALKLDAGTRISFEELQPGSYGIKRATKVPVTTLKAMFGKHPTAISVEEMNASIARRVLQ